MQKIIIKQNIKKDAWNWWNACNKVSYGEDWKQRVSEEIRNEIVGKTMEQAFVFLIPFLKQLYEKEKIMDKQKEMQNVFDLNGENVFLRMEQVTGQKIYRESFTCFMTTFPRAPYDFQNGYVWIPVVWSTDAYISIFTHELLHFQTYAYWQSKCLKILSNEEFENLKEALTFVLNEEFLDIIVWKDKGYKMHESFREELLKFWKKNKNFDKLISYGVKVYHEL